MLKIHTLPLGDYQTNTYIIHDDASTSCAIIDPGYEAGTILAQVNKLGLTVDAVLLTHGHFDHVGAVREIVEATGCKLWMRESDWSQKPSPMNLYFYPLANCDFTEVQFCEESETISAGGLTFTVLETPGHSWGSVCIRTEDILFSGDTLFAGSIGRTDFPGSSPETMAESLSFLKEIQENLSVYPGHGSSTTLSQEKLYNPYLR